MFHGKRKLTKISGAKPGSDPLQSAGSLDGSKVDSAFHPSEVDEMSTRNIWELSGKK